jgi:hypothetical protein
MSPNRIVALITPLCALGAGWAATWLADNVPGVDISKESLQAVFIAGALAVLTPAIQWLHGWQKYEERNDQALAAAATGFGMAGAAAAPAAAPPEEFSEALGLDDDFAEFDDIDDFDEFEDTSVADDEQPVPAGA